MGLGGPLFVSAPAMFEVELRVTLDEAALAEEVVITVLAPAEKAFFTIPACPKTLFPGAVVPTLALHPRCKSRTMEAPPPYPRGDPGSAASRDRSF